MGRISTVVAGIGMGESARWHNGTLWYADWMARTVSVLESGGTASVVATVPSFPISFDWFDDGRTVVVSGGTAEVLAGFGGRLARIAGLGHLSPDPWNELAVHPGGALYVDGIGYDFAGPPRAEGLIARVAPDGTATRVAGGLAFPNGMVISPDGALLVVAESHAGRLTCFDIGDDGALENRRVWAAVEGSAPDGICWSPDGGIWYADVPNRRCVLVREGGEVADAVQFPQGCFSCAVGGTGGDLLFVTAADWPGAMDAAGPKSGRVLAVQLAQGG